MLKDPRSFDQTKPLVAAMFFTARDHDFTVGSPVEIAEAPEAPGQVTLDEAIHLWRGGRIDYSDSARPTPVEPPVDEAKRLTELDDLGDGKFMVRAPWLEEAIIVEGKDAADAAVASTIKLGLETAGLVAEPQDPEVPDGPTEFAFKEAGSNGYYEITGPGIEPYKVRGLAAAEAAVKKHMGLTDTDETEAATE